MMGAGAGLGYAPHPAPPERFVLIRCEKCSTTYELDERRIPPGGAPVQCSRCEHVFRAYPQSRRSEGSGPEGDRRPGLELVPPPPDDLPDDAAAPVAQAELPGISEPGLSEPGTADAGIADPGMGDAAPESVAEAAEPASTQQEWPAAPLEPAEPTEPAVSPPYAVTAKTPTPGRVASGPRASATTPPPTVPGASAPASGATAASSAGPAVPSEGAPGAGAVSGAGASTRPPSGSTYKPPPGPVIPPGKPVRKVPNPELEGSDVTSVAPMPRRAVSFDVKPKKRSKSSWIVNGAVGLLVLLIIAGTISWWQERSAEKAARAAPTAAPAPSRALTRERQEAMKLLMRDDAASVERAAAQLDDIVRREQATGARADRALALALLSEQAREQAARLEARAAALEEERGRAGAGAVTEAGEPGADPETLRAEVEPLQERARRLLSEARAELDALPASLRGDVAAVRARAWIQLVSGSRDEAAQTAGAPGAVEDPWIALASIVAGLPEGASADAHERGAGQLEQLAAKHPGFVRPLLLAGRIRAGLGDGERALADLDGALRANPQHLEARRVRAEIAPAIPEASGAADEGSAPMEGAPPAGSPAENERSQGGNAPTAPPGR
jgi:predicted Zn finger-like uncharacterized protein